MVIARRRSAIRRQRRSGEPSRARQGTERRSAEGGYRSAISGLRLLGIVLASLWLALAVGVLVAYPPGVPFRLLLLAAIFIPVPIAMLAVVFPPVGHDQREAAAIGWLALIDVLLL